MKSQINWGFIGCGHVVETKSGMAFNNVKNSAIHAIMRRNINVARDSAIKLNANKWYDNIRDLLSDNKVDAIYIATPPGLHYEQALECCHANKPVYIEKPFTRNYDEAVKIVKCFEQKNIPLFVAHYRRALPRFIKIKNIIDNGEIGNVMGIDFQLFRKYSKKDTVAKWLYDPVLSGGGKFYDIAPHAIDIIIFLFGDIVEVQGYATNNNTNYLVEDFVVMSFKTKNNVLGTANFNLLANEKKDRMVVYGDNGKLEFSIHDNDQIIITKERQQTILEIMSPPLIEQPMVETVVKELTGVGKCPCTGREALPTVKVMDLVLSDYYNGRNDAFWDRPTTWKFGKEK